MKIMLLSAVFFMVCGTVLAEEVQGKITKIDTDRSTLTLSVENKDRTLSIAKGLVIQSLGKKKKPEGVLGGLADLKKGDEATVTIEKKDGKEVITRVVISVAKKPKVPVGSRKVVSVDVEKSTITLSVDGKDQTLKVEKGAPIQKSGKMKKLEEVEGGLKGINSGDEATLTLEKKDEKEVVTRIVLVGKKKTK
ncbi:MAG: hypothetical protein NTV55_14585 [Planctomycetota bacterium]|nr:hypothetical protein [Planctomycetota bacterium]